MKGAGLGHALAPPLVCPLLRNQRAPGAPLAVTSLSGLLTTPVSHFHGWLGSWGVGCSLLPRASGTRPPLQLEAERSAFPLPFPPQLSVGLKLEITLLEASAPGHRCCLRSDSPVGLRAGAGENFKVAVGCGGWGRGDLSQVLGEAVWAGTSRLRLHTGGKEQVMGDQRRSAGGRRPGSLGRCRKPMEPHS